MLKHIVFVGAGHAHVTCLDRLDEFMKQGHMVTVVGPGPHHYYSGMGPGMLGDVYSPEEIRIPVRRMVEDRGGTFIEDKVVGIEPDFRTVLTRAGRRIHYDIVSFNTGSSVPGDVVAGGAKDVFPVKPIERLQEAQARVNELLKQGPVRVAVAGGGAAGVEIAGNVHGFLQRTAERSIAEKSEVVLIAGSKLLKRFGGRTRKLVRRSFESRDIAVHEGKHIRTVDSGCVQMEDGERIEADLIFLCLGVQAQGPFHSSGLSYRGEGEDSPGLWVNEKLHHPRHPNIFGGGDCIRFGPKLLEKIGVHAVRQNPILFHNIQALAAGEELQEYRPRSRRMLILNLGDGTGVLQKGGITFNGRASFLIKDWIDRRFIRKYSG